MLSLTLITTPTMLFLFSNDEFDGLSGMHEQVVFKLTTKIQSMSTEQQRTLEPKENDTKRTKKKCWLATRSTQANKLKKNEWGNQYTLSPTYKRRRPLLCVDCALRISYLTNHSC